MIVERRDADSLLECDADTILLETSLALKPSSMSVEDHDEALAEIFTTHFVPLSEFTEISDDSFGRAPFVGLHIRRTDHLKYVPEARTSVSDWVKLISTEVPAGERVFLCSDDTDFAGRVAADLPDHPILRFDAEYDSKPARKAFLEFLCLSRATRIYGTAGSSFSREAARFGGKPISTCTPKPPGLVDRLKSRIGLA